MGAREAEYGTVWYQKIDGEEIDGIEGKYELDAKGSELVVTVYPRNDDRFDDGSRKILFPWRRVMRIDSHEPPVEVDTRIPEGAPGDI